MKIGHVDDNCTACKIGFFSSQDLYIDRHALKIAILHLLLVTQCRDTSVTYFMPDIPKRVFF